MEYSAPTDWSGEIRRVRIGATRADGGTRTVSYEIGGNTGLPFVEPKTGLTRPLVAYELCDDPGVWSPLVVERVGETVTDLAGWTKFAERELGPDLIRVYLTSTRRRGFEDFDAIGNTIRTVLEATGLPLCVEGPNEPSIESEAFRRIGEAGEGERLLLGTAEASRYRSVAAAALAYHHAVIAQSPIDVNLAKQLNILLREIGVPPDQIVIDPYTGALGYGFEYTYSAMERIRYAALKGDTDLAMPMITSAIDSLTIKEVRDAPPGDAHRTAVAWEVTTGLASAVAGSAIVCVRHPDSVAPLRAAIAATWGVN
ncbi:MAG TPA: acetyl-CoA decarbonylase/synthase complex subunit delta [Methanoregulaceae archaeon]|nr:acetyl-CoA decarbonylase/synthase complex subunit delta [Methanoregulaceae archaeon]HOV67192.1 acetyl-CoA decarbonylase/synthase complex subunit delta [Methanoregulaceae archaeon]HQJ87145.1 acetyl-CoA decarbonylase/synthase complex subunit delta [Methanoregulaceae archaeon]